MCCSCCQVHHNYSCPLDGSHCHTNSSCTMLTGIAQKSRSPTRRRIPTTARRGRPFRHRCVELHSPLPQHFNARLPRSFLKQPHYGPVGAGLNSHLSPCHTQTRRLKNLQETLATDKPVSQWISPSALVKFAFTRLLGTEKRLGDFQPASKRTCCGGPACLWSVGLGRRVRGEGRD